MSEKEKDGLGLDKRGRIDLKRSGDEQSLEEPLEPPFPYTVIPFPETFDT